MSNMMKSIFACSFYTLVSITCLTSLCSDPNPQRSAFNAVKHAMNGNGLYTPFSNEYIDKLNSQEHEDKLFPNKKGLIMTLLGVAGTGMAIYHGVNAWKGTIDSGLVLANDVTKTVNNDMKTQYEKQVQDKLNEFKKWKEEEAKRIEEENKKIAAEKERIDFHHRLLDDKRKGCLQHHTQIMNEFGDLLGAKSAVDTLSYSQLQMLSASELVAGGGKTYFTDLFSKETKRLSEQIKKGQTDEVKAVMSFLSQKKNNNSSQSPVGSREGSRSSSPQRNQNQV